MAKPELGELKPPARILLGPGPSNVDPRVYRAMMAPVLGHLDPEFIHIMDETQTLMRRLFVTENRLTFPVSGTGSALRGAHGRHGQAGGSRSHRIDRSGRPAG
jgi:alanine-glyoxylate transaminase/serine-glyoxylate transaminase/serine-pyruvate transaminase